MASPPEPVAAQGEAVFVVDPFVDPTLFEGTGISPLEVRVLEDEVDQWAPITDADLEDDEEEAPQPELARLVTLPTPVVPPKKICPQHPNPIYTAADWEIFNKWIHVGGYSIDQAAACAGIRVHDALVAMEQRSPLYYQIVVMRSPQCGSEPSRRRRKGTGCSSAIGGYRGAGLHEHGHQVRRQRLNPDSPMGETRPSEDEARRRFLALLGDHHPEDRIDGIRLSVRRNRAMHPATGRKVKQKAITQRQLVFTARRCKTCGRLGHGKGPCPNLAD